MFWGLRETERERESNLLLPGCAKLFGVREEMCGLWMSLHFFSILLYLPLSAAVYTPRQALVQYEKSVLAGFNSGSIRAYSPIGEEQFRYDGSSNYLSTMEGMHASTSVAMHVDAAMSICVPVFLSTGTYSSVPSSSLSAVQTDLSTSVHLSRYQCIGLSVCGICVGTCLVKISKRFVDPRLRVYLHGALKIRNEHWESQAFVRGDIHVRL